ncbi:RidA family protein [Phosphitispora sp. TUW77]|uniref:RidA family protein n=1 Tax=Phosphitispora sp. TUW77 TaxID=3152361 RepID=UPI003AB712D6
MIKKAITAEGTVSVGPYSHAVESGGFIYLSGQVPIDFKTGKIVEGDIIAQTKQCFKNISNILSTAGLIFDNIIKVTVFLLNMDDFTKMNSVYEKHFSAPFPARTTIGAAQLPLGAGIEIEVIAKRD